MKEEKRLHEQYALLLPHLNERDSRLTLAAEAISLGFGGITKVFKATGVARSTITTGIHELKEKKAVEGRIRRHGGGRKKQEEKDTTLISALDKIIEPTTRGDPESPLRWTTKSMMKLAKALSKRGHQVSHTVVGRIIKGLGYSLQSLRKREEGKQHPDRDGQFRHI